MPTNLYKRELVKEEKERLPEDNSQLIHQVNIQTIHKAVSGEINALTEKGSPVGTDVLLLEDSAASYAKKKVQITNLPGGGDSDAIHDNVADEIHQITEKTTPVSADEVIIEDSANSWNKKRLTYGNLQSNLSITESQISNLDHTDTDAIHDNVSGEINAITEKTALVGNDLILIEDSEASNAKKKAKLSNIPMSLSGQWGYMILQLFPRSSDWGNGYLIANAIDEGIQLNFSLGTWIDPNTDLTITIYYNCTSSDSEVACKLYLGAAAVGSEQPSWNIENGTAINLDSTTALNMYKHDITIDNGDVVANDYIHCQVRLNEASRTINFRNAEVKFKYA